MSSPHTEGLQLYLLDSGEGERLLRIAGELDIGGAGPLRHSLRALEDRPLLLDLSGLTFMDSTGLGLLLDQWRRRAQEGEALRIRGARGQVLDLLTRTGTLPLLGDPPLAGSGR